MTYTTEKIQQPSAWGQAGVVVSRGELTIRQARADDEGAYTCEALNGKGSLFAVPDTIVHVLRKCSDCSHNSVGTERLLGGFDALFVWRPDYAKM